jgi:hypothetical protein
VLDADIRGFFDNLDIRWMLKFVQHRVADPRVLRLIQKWPKAGVMEEGKWSETEKGTPQGYYVFDLWVDVWRKKCAQGDVIVVRYAADIASYVARHIRCPNERSYGSVRGVSGNGHPYRDPRVPKGAIIRHGYNAPVDRLAVLEPTLRVMPETERGRIPRWKDFSVRLCQSSPGPFSEWSPILTKVGGRVCSASFLRMARHTPSKKGRL